MSTTTTTTVQTHSLGYPRIGENRELKKATEAYWKGDLSKEALLSVGKELRLLNWKKQQAAGIDWIPVNDFSFYDQVLDMSCLLGNAPPRFELNQENLDLDAAFTIARGMQTGVPSQEDDKDCQTGKVSTFASEMTKWFDTNYHYIVPEFRADTTFSIRSTKIFDELEEAISEGILAKPVLIGPVTYLSLGKVQDSKHPDFDPFSLLPELIDVYERILNKLVDAGAEWIQLDEPILSTDLSPQQIQALETAYQRFSSCKAHLLVATYFGAVRENVPTMLGLPVKGLHFDFIRGSEDADEVLETFPSDKILSVGVVEGRNIWKNDYEQSWSILKKAEAKIGKDRLWIAPSCSLLHVPVSLKQETKLDQELKNWLAFADEKLNEVSDLRNLIEANGAEEALKENLLASSLRQISSRIHDPAVKSRLEAVRESDFNRQSPFGTRQEKQTLKLELPEFPTTTIGSFPQTREIRSVRAKKKRGEISAEEYEAFLKEETAKCVRFQEEIDIDMPVHGEFERNDMVEYFGEHLEGFAFTTQGWVQSYGSRYVKPPVLFGDVSRPEAMTVKWSEYAQSLTPRPMKGMLTGPVTILQWSFVRDDQPREKTAQQIALAIRDEVIDLEQAGLAAIQIDEPAFREGLPLRQREWPYYLDWAVKAFRLSASGVRDDTQIHTHMCYSEFNDIIESIADMDADVITIETSRSNMELLEAFVDFAYPNEIGPGVYDIHSPRIPSTGEMKGLMEKAEKVLPRRNLWINPDCGLKTRQWQEVSPSLRNMVEAAKSLRALAQT